jgi:predicted DNA-binding transcriptional regulator AlpA
MKAVSKINQVKEMLANNPKLKATDLVQTLGVKKSYAYALMAEAKRPKAEKRKYTRTTMTKKEGMAVLGKEVLQGRQAIDRLIAENNRLCSLIQEKDNTITALKIDMLDQQAVINYLEKKLIK